MDKPIIAIVAGGYSGEFGVSLRSAEGIYSWINQDVFTPYIYIIERSRWYVLIEGHQYEIDRADFSFELDGKRIRPSYAYITIHGTPGEDGIIQGYLDTLGIPYNTGGVLTEALTANKYCCNRYLSTFSPIRIARSVRLTRQSSATIRAQKLAELTLPIFVKPNTGGSSVATSKVEHTEELASAIELALSESPEVILEEYISGTEVTCGAYALDGKVIALPITEVVTSNKFFDFDAKYHGQVEEITPARISSDLTELIQTLTKEIYEYIQAKGIIRVDYIIETDGRPTLLEVNTTPGMTPTSFIPQQVRAAGLDMKTLLTNLIAEELSK